MTQWVTSSYSAGNGACVQMGITSDPGVLLRDSKDPDGPMLLVTQESWAVFIQGVKRGHFNL